MSTTIDHKVVEMRFDNRQFENGARTSISTLDKLKQSLNLSGASKGLNDISTAVRGIDMTGLSSSVGTLSAKFTALQVAGVTALANITNSAVNAGKRIVSALTIDPIKTGFQEYETQINAVQTILANTESKGSTLEDVNNALDELNLYADKTIYNFTEMTRNIGTFTAAGVDLNTSVSAIKGIANLAAVSGSTSQQASTAMYQLSQALASGTVKLMDWNSVVNAGMGGQVFQDALKETARVHGINIDAMIKKEGSFRETLQKGWLSSEILTETLAKFTGDLTEEQLKSIGYTDEQIKKILKMGQTANDAATKVKTFTQLFDTLKEAAQSGWTQTWEILVGDFEEAKKLLTEISDVFSAIISKSADSRNKLLQGWKDLGGREDIIQSFRNAFEAIGKIIKPISQAFREIFPQATAKQLKNISKGIKNFTEKLKISDQTAEKIKGTFKGVFSIFDIFRKTLVAVGKVIASLFSSGGITGLADFFLSITASIGDFFTSLNKGINFSGVTNGLSKIVSGISELIKKAVGGLNGFGDALSKIGSIIAKVAKSIFSAVGDVFTWIADNVSIGDIFAGLAGGGIFVTAKKLAGLFDKIKEAIGGLFGEKEGSSIKEQFADVLGSVRDTLSAFTSGIKVASLLTISIAIGILSASLKSISKLNSRDIAKSLASIGIMFTMLNVSFKSISKTIDTFPVKGLAKAGATMILMATAIKILASAIVKLSVLSIGQLAKGLTAVGVGLTELAFGLKAINKVKIKISTSIAILALAKACKILGNALIKFGSMKWGEITRGLIGMGGALTEMTIILKYLNNFGGIKSISGSVGLLITVQSLSKMADGLKKIGELSWKEIRKGLIGMGGSLIEVAGITGALGKLAGISSIFGAGAIWITVQGLKKLASAFKEFGSMSWGEIGRGIVGMGGALLEVAGITGGLGTIAGLSSILGGSAIWISVQGLGKLANALKKFGEMSWSEIGRGLAAMAGALSDIALGGIANTFSIIGSWSINNIAEGLGILADSVKKWVGIIIPGNLRTNLGLLAAGIAQFTFSGLGAGALAISAEAVGTLADSVKKWVGVTVPNGLSDKMESLASGVKKFTFTGVGARALSLSAGPVGILADSIKKWKDVTIPEGLGDGLKDIANGISAFAGAFVGGWSINAVINPLAKLANSVNKWKNVTIQDSLKKDLTNLADGVKSFTWAFVGGWSLDAIVGPLGRLASSVSKWKDVSISKDLSSQLSKLSGGVKSFTWAFVGGWSLDKVSGPLGFLADAVKKWKGISIPDNMEDKLKSLATGIKQFNMIGDISTATVNTNKIAGAAVQLAKVNFNSISSGLSTFASSLAAFSSSSTSFSGVGDRIVSNIMKPINAAGSKFTTAGGKLIASLARGISSKTGSVSVALGSSIIKALATVNTKYTSFIIAGRKLGSALSSGVDKGVAQTKNTVAGSISTIVSSINNFYESFYNAGSYLVEGFCEGITANGNKATTAAWDMAKNAERAAKSALGEHSPSKVFYKIGDYAGIGFINALDNYVEKAHNITNKVGESAKEGLSGAISKVKNFIDSGIDSTPTIAPVLDLSNVSDGVRAINRMIGMGSTIGLSSNVDTISTMINSRNQNGVNDDVVSAINKLGESLGGLGGDTYHIDGVIYDDGTNVSDAVRTLIRAAKIERRV